MSSVQITSSDAKKDITTIVSMDDKIRTYSQIVKDEELCLSDEERDYVLTQLKSVEVSSNIADVASVDPMKSSQEIVYYKSLKHKVFSVFDVVQDNFSTAQAFNLYLIDRISKAVITRQNWPKVGVKSTLKTSRVGDITEINKVISELIYLFQIKDDIDYSASVYKGFSPVVNWLLKTINVQKKNEGVPHVTISKADHIWLCEKLKVEGETLAYKLFQQTIALLVYHAGIQSSTPFYKRLRAILAGEVNGLVIKQNQSDLTNIEPYYVWNAVTSPEERGVLTKLVGDNFFNSQNKLLRKFRSAKPETAALELGELKKKVDSKIPQGVKATIYGRLNVYRKIKEKPEVTRLLTERKGTKQLSITETYRYAKEQSAISLFAPENIIATAHGIINKPTELMDLTRQAYLNQDTGLIFYYKGDIESTLTYKSLISKKDENRITAAEIALLASIDSRAIQFVPGVSHRH